MGSALAYPKGAGGVRRRSPGCNGPRTDTQSDGAGGAADGPGKAHVRASSKCSVWDAGCVAKFPARIFRQLRQQSPICPATRRADHHYARQPPRVFRSGHLRAATARAAAAASLCLAC